MQRLMSVLLLVATACGGDGGSSMLTDASGATDASGTSDAPLRSGLTIQWVAAPELPGPQNLPAMVDVTSAKLHVKKLEAISDGGAVPETTSDDLDVLWSATMRPLDIYFGSAPPAIYSKVRVALDKGPSNAPSIEIHGTVVIDGTTEPFHITSLQKTDLEVKGYSVRLDVGEAEGMPVIVRLDSLLGDVAWAQLPTIGGVRTLDDTSISEMDRLLDRLEDALSGPNE